MLNRRSLRPSWVNALLLVLALSYGLMLAWQEWQFRQAPTGLEQAPAAAPTAPAVVPLNMLAVATVLGLTAPSNVVNSAEPLTLRATLVSSDSESRALLAGPQGERFYRAGERLPGGSLLRRIEFDHVVLWRQGREERLLLRPAGERFFQVFTVPPQGAVPDPLARHIRPMAEHSRSD